MYMVTSGCGFYGSANEKRLKRVRDIIDNKSMLRETFERIFDKEQEKEKP